MVENKNGMRIILDTNAIMAIFNYGIDIIDLINKKYKAEYYVTKSILNELKAIANDPKRKGRYRRNAKLALQYLKIINAQILNLDGKTDEILKDLSKDFVILTLDKDLKREIIKKGGFYMELRGGKLYTNYPDL
ncbi:NEQ313 [Nanoarchaeum equitans Kin4-M]|uniref:NEQ313 n=1 Tax=Nanoarchaeum equitans (strain Kin4-M) TaxID=228908 RepID=Q74NH7_NANEQ|nr:NEQ313 [Nanoarchaeum equitans Kin4-M]